MNPNDDIQIPATPATASAGAPAPHPARGRSRTKQWVAPAAIAGALLGTTGIAMAQTSDGSYYTVRDAVDFGINMCKSARA